MAQREVGGDYPVRMKGDIGIHLANAIDGELRVRQQMRCVGLLLCRFARRSDGHLGLDCGCARRRHRCAAAEEGAEIREIERVRFDNCRHIGPAAASIDRCSALNVASPNRSRQSAQRGARAVAAELGLHAIRRRAGKRQARQKIEIGEIGS